MKKIIAVILVGFSIMTCFAACGEKEEIVNKIDPQYVANEIERSYNFHKNQGHEVEYLYDENGTKTGIIFYGTGTIYTYDYSRPAMVSFDKSTGKMTGIEPTITQERNPDS